MLKGIGSGKSGWQWQKWFSSANVVDTGKSVWHRRKWLAAAKVAGGVESGLVAVIVAAAKVATKRPRMVTRWWLEGSSIGRKHIGGVDKYSQIEKNGGGAFAHNQLRCGKQEEMRIWEEFGNEI